MRLLNKEHSSRKAAPMRHIKDWRVILIATIITALSMTVWITYINKHTNEAQLQRALQTKIEALNKQTTTSQQLEAEKLKLKQELEAAQKALQAKKAAQTVYAATLPQKPPTTAVKVSGSCSDWMVQAGVPITAATTKLILNESGCNPGAINKSSGACGIPQALPCSKMGCTLTDPVCQLRWMQGYVQNRYGTWENALAMWHSRCGTKAGCWY